MATPNFQNRTLFHGDNLKFLRGINSGTIDLIATDPPFNKGRDFHATPDSLAKGAKFQDRWSWADDVEQAWVDEIEDSAPGVAWAIESARVTYGEDMAAFLCFLGVRLIEMHRVLKDTGSIYLHCDPTANGYIRTLMDAIFGRKNFRNEIVWAYTGPGSPKMRQFNRKHDTIFWYSKGEEWTFNKDAVRIPYKDGSPHTGGFKWGDGSDMDAEVAASYSDGKIPETWWTDFAIVARHKSIKQGGERTGYPTQKPLALYERIIRASSNLGDVVLDPFAGCATTPIAAERLGRQWLAMDLWDDAYKMISDRLAGLGLLAADDERRDQRLSAIGEVHREIEPPERTDGGEVAAPYLQVTERYDIPADGSPRTRAGMLEHLLAQHGSRCQGCDREFDDPRYLQLDHNTPRADGGLNHISNRVLLCGPCNRLKGAAYTLTGLRRENAKHGYMAGG